MVARKKRGKAGKPKRAVRSKGRTSRRAAARAPRRAAAKGKAATKRGAAARRGRATGPRRAAAKPKAAAAKPKVATPKPKAAAPKGRASSPQRSRPAQPKPSGRSAPSPRAAAALPPARFEALPAAGVQGPPAPSRQRIELARRILALAPRLELSDRGRAPAASALRNVQDTAAGGRATRGSPFGTTQGRVDLAVPMLAALVALAERGYRLVVTDLAGGVHPPESPHYLGAAFTVGRLNGRPVAAGHSDLGRFGDDCRRLGATRVLGPGDPGHDAALHVAWPPSP